MFDDFSDGWVVEGVATAFADPQVNAMYGVPDYVCKDDTTNDMERFALRYIEAVLVTLQARVIAIIYTIQADKAHVVDPQRAIY